MYCAKCGKQIGENSKFCEQCGAEVGGTGNVPAVDTKKERDGILELVAGLIPIVLILFMFYIEDTDNIYNGTIGGILTLLSLMCIFIACIIGIATRKNIDKKGVFTAGVLCLISSLFMIIKGVVVGLLYLEGFKWILYQFPWLIILICSALFFYCAYKRNNINNK